VEIVLTYVVKVNVRTKNAVRVMTAMGGSADIGIDGENAGDEACID